ncbi:MAG TPA: DUF305 domain-containing protein [Mycobacteriales bacterium]|jgi:uncharacterized protein (DUF305 family)|nr:DUF305 domain-containing protein [Mycobacteriales bacterium]
MIAASSPAGGRVWRRLPNLIEIALVVVIAVALGRLSNHDSSAPKPGAVDIGFSQDMAVHHEQAVLMADLALTRGGSAVASLANAILIDQSQEVGMMRGWLKLWNSSTVDPAPMSWMPQVPKMSMPPMMLMSGPVPLSGTRTMPGMATPEQLTRLSTLSGKRFDVLFLQLMIRHHQGGLVMCQYAQADAKLAIVRKAATAMAVEQIEDLGQMQAILKADGGNPLPQP